MVRSWNLDGRSVFERYPEDYIQREHMLEIGSNRNSGLILYPSVFFKTVLCKSDQFSGEKDKQTPLYERKIA